METWMKRRRWEVLLWWVIGPAAAGLLLYGAMNFGQPLSEMKKSKIVITLMSVFVGALIVRTIPEMLRLMFAMVESMTRDLAELVQRVRALRHETVRRVRVEEGRVAEVARDDAEASAGEQAVAERRRRERLAVGVMTREFEKSLSTSSVALLVALLVVGIYAVATRDRSMIVLATVIGVFFLLAIARQVILKWRAANGYFGSSEHEVRELLAFAMRHPTPDDFYDDDGHLLPAFDLRPEQMPAAAAVGQPIAGAV